MITKELEYLTLWLIKKHKEEILGSGDWWHGLPEWSINVFDYTDKGEYSINLYPVGQDGMDDYSDCYSLPTLTETELRTL